MRWWLLVASLVVCCAACQGKKEDLNPPDAPVIPPGRSPETSPKPPAPGTSPIPAR